MINRPSLPPPVAGNRSADTGNDLRVTVTRLMRRKTIFLGVFMTVAATVAAFTATAPVLYTATSTVRIGDQSQEGVFAQQTRYTDPRREVETQRAVIASPQVEELVRVELTDDVFDKLDEVSVTGARNADLIDIAVTAPDPEIAARAAKVWASQYVELRREQTAGWLKSMEDELRLRAAEATEKIDEIDTELVSAPDTRTAVLRAQRDALQEQYLQFTQRADELAVEGQVRRGGVSIVAEPEVPDAPSSPDVARNAVLGLIAALVLASAAAYSRERFDDRVRGEDDLGLLRHRPALLGSIPDIKAWRRRKSAGLLGFDDQNAEAFRQLRVSLDFADFERQHKRIAFVSPLPGEGKSALVANMAVALAMSGRKVVLVDLDLRKSRQRQLFALGANPGFTDVVAGSASLRDAVCRINLSTTGGGWLQVVPSGPCPPNPAELLSSTSTSRFFEAVSAHADIVLIDTPAMLVVADAAATLPHANTTVVVTSARSSRRTSLQRCLDLVAASTTPVLGVILNAVPRREVSHGGYYYGYEYSETEKEPRRRRLRPRRQRNRTRSTK